MDSHNGHINTSSGPVLDRRIFIGAAGIVVALAAFAGMRGLMGCSGSGRESLELFVSDRTPDECVQELVGRLETSSGVVNLTMFSDGEMDESAWRSAASGSSSWVVFGACDSDARILSGLDCHDWANEAYGVQDALAFSFGDGPLQAFPIEGNLGMLLCNMDLLESVGAGTSSSASSLAEVCSLLRASGIKPFALEQVDANSESVNLVLDAVLASVSGSVGVQAELTDEEIAACAASVLRCGKNEEGGSAFATREEALRGFESGDAAMLILSSDELDCLSNIGFSCMATSIPMVFAGEVSAFKPTRSVVCSSQLSEDACSVVLDYLMSKNEGELLSDAGGMSSIRNDSQGMTFKDLPDSIYLGVGPAVLVEGSSFDDTVRQGYVERIFTMWNQGESDWDSYMDEVGVAL